MLCAYQADDRANYEHIRFGKGDFVLWRGKLSYLPVSRPGADAAHWLFQFIMAPVRAESIRSDPSAAGGDIGSMPGVKTLLGLGLVHCSVCHVVKLVGSLVRAVFGLETALLYFRESSHWCDKCRAVWSRPKPKRRRASLASLARLPACRRSPYLSSGGLEPSGKFGNRDV
jgi:hypothetical protein